MLSGAKKARETLYDSTSLSSIVFCGTGCTTYTIVDKSKEKPLKVEEGLLGRPVVLVSGAKVRSFESVGGEMQKGGGKTLT